MDEGRYTWRHNSVLLFLANTFSSLKQCTVYAALPSFLSPCFITGESYRPDLLLLTDKNILYILELTVGFKTNIQNNSDRKATKYSSLINDLSLSLSLSRYLGFVTFAAGMVIYINFHVYCFVSCTNSEIVVLKLKASFSKESSLILLLMWVL